jgi:acyl-CoA hydrolase
MEQRRGENRAEAMEENGMEGKPVSAGRVTMAHSMLPQDANAAAAIRHCRVFCATAGRDRLDLRAPEHIGNRVF